MVCVCTGDHIHVGREVNTGKASSLVLTIHPIFKDRVGSSFSVNKDLRDKPRLARPVGSRDSASTSINTGFQAMSLYPAFT